jgi:hypothetical protein
VVSSRLAASEPTGFVDANRWSTTHAKKVRCFRQNRRRGSVECTHGLVSWERRYNRRRFEVHRFLFPKQEQGQHLWQSEFGFGCLPSGSAVRPNRRPPGVWLKVLVERQETSESGRHWPRLLQSIPNMKTGGSNAGC